MIKKSANRTPEFVRNTNLESLLKELNPVIALAEEKLAANYRIPEFPMLFIVGPLRSGTTLFIQWLANTGLFSYPTNLLSRFYCAPILGAKIQLLLTDHKYNFRDELCELLYQTAYQSENGKTKGVLAPNEFWYFWRRFLAEPERDIWSDKELRETMNAPLMLAELAGVMDVFQKPFAAKGMLFNYNIPFLNSLFDKVLFVQIKRELVTNVASILEARKRQLGSEREWYSFLIPEYSLLKDLDPVTQAAGQLHYINKAVTEGLSNVNASRKLLVQYEDFCNCPEKVYEHLIEKIDLSGRIYDGPKNFRVIRKVNSPQQSAIENALLNFKN